MLIHYLLPDVSHIYTIARLYDNLSTLYLNRLWPLHTYRKMGHSHGRSIRLWVRL